MDHKYSVPIIPQNLNKHETIIQIAEVLEHLSNISINIFDKVDRKICDNQHKLANISERIQAVKGKLDHLKSIKTATQVFSSCRYPATDKNQEYVSVFHDAQPFTINKRKIKPKNVSTAYEPLDKLQFYHVNESNGNTTNSIETDISLDDFKFVNDLYISGKNMSPSTDTKCALNIREEENKLSEIGDAPRSISDRSTLTLSQHYFYAPKIGDVPALDVPLDLPDLPGIANDLHYDKELGPVITPSTVITPSLMEDISSVNVTKDYSADSPSTEKVTTAHVTVQEVPKLNSKQKPPLCESNQVTVTSEINNVSTISELDTSRESAQCNEALPSGNPPVVEEAKSVTVPKPEVLLADDMRSSLMEAIRNAGGAGKATLRNIKKIKEEEPPPNSGGDLMADLHSKLFMRRKGISGVKKTPENGVDAETTLGRISAMIPPPEPKTDLEWTSNDEEDWD